MDQQWAQKSFFNFFNYDLGDRDIRGAFEDLKCFFLRLWFHLDIPLSVFGMLVNSVGSFSIAFFNILPTYESIAIYFHKMAFGSSGVSNTM